MDELTFFVCFFGTLFVVFSWAFWCIEKAGSERIWLIQNRDRDDLYWQQDAEFEKVTFNRHLWARILFRDPFKLYGPLTQELLYRKRDA